MKIQQISVKGLFGIFDHVIPLNLDEHITIIHGPNGFGKTVMLRMLSGLFNRRYASLLKIPFTQFQIQFETESYIELVNTVDKYEKKCLVITLYKSTVAVESYTFQDSETQLQKKSQTESQVDWLDEIVPGLQRINFEQWLYLPTGEILSFGEVLERFNHLIPSRGISDEEPEWLSNLRSGVHVCLIESHRLLNILPNRDPRTYYTYSPMLPTVSIYSIEMAAKITSALAEYGSVSQSIDREFPAKFSSIISKSSPITLTDEQLLQRLNELEEKRLKLIELGLLNKDESPNFQVQSLTIEESTRNVLAVYVEDVEKKLSVFSDISSKIDLLRRIINRKFAYSYKEMNFNKEKGFVLKTLYHPAIANGKSLSPTDLSSGEQHELVLLYELLFKVQPNSLVLIDEPELSLHVGWQSQFLQDLQEITKLADLDILMATHSPDIIQDRWDLTVELKGPEK